MKVTWEEDDIRVGRRYGKLGVSERWIIGYLSTEDSAKRVVSTSLVDGMVTPPATTAEVACHLTACGYLPEELL